MTRKIDLTGQRFGRLVVISENVKERNSSGFYWNCKCDCGNEKIVQSQSLRRQVIKSCGCLFMERNDLRGKRFGRLIVLEKLKGNYLNATNWLCQCDCGNKTTVITAQLNNGNTKSCGCLVRDRIRNACLKDMTGRRFGRLVVIGESNRRNKSRGVYWNCKCDCGQNKEIDGSSLRRGVTKSCGCLAKERVANMNKKNICGVKSGRLIALHRLNELDSTGCYYWYCKCECGNYRRASVKDLNSKHVRSCGCLHKDSILKGENSPHYNPTITDEERLKRRYILGKESKLKWQKQIFKRDDYTCQICNKRGVTLNAHHLDSWNWCKEKRFDIVNGITICENCHKSFHFEYGSGDNTKKQFIEFKKKRTEWNNN